MVQVEVVNVDVKWVVRTLDQRGEEKLLSFTEFKLAQEFAKEEAKRLLASGPVVLYKAERVFSASVELKEVTAMAQ